MMLKQHLGIERSDLPLLAADRRSRIRTGMMITLPSFSSFSGSFLSYQVGCMFRKGSSPGSSKIPAIAGGNITIGVGSASAVVPL
jgi:hypothetical protein